MSKHKQDNKSYKNIIFASLFTIIGIWIGGWVFSDYAEITKQPVNDIFSSLSALFGGLAFAGVIISIYMQLDELKDTRAELNKTAIANAEMAKTNYIIAKRSSEKFILDLFQTYQSDYFQSVKNDSQKVLFSCVSCKEYCDFVVSRLFVADTLDFPKNRFDYLKINMPSLNIDELIREDQKFRYKLDELINFFTLIGSDDSMLEVIKKSDFSYSFWRPLFLLISKKQKNRYQTNKIIEKYGTKPYFSDIVDNLDKAYGFKSYSSNKELWNYFSEHPKIKPFLDKKYTKDNFLTEE